MRAIGFQLLWIWGVKEMSCIGWDVSQEPELTKLEESRQSSQQILLHSRRSAEAFPPGVRYDLAVDRGRAILRDLVDPLAHEIILEADLLTRAESNRIIDVLVREVEAHKDSSPPVVKIPEQVDAVINTTAEWDRSRDTLVAFLGRKHEHPLLLDLVQAGPHAVVTGMTGSGKTEFLISWLTSLAAMYPPDRLSLLLIDYKGGAGFSKLHNLPHVVGVLTDLTPEQTQRAVTSLRAEIRFREQQLAEAAVADISDLPEDVDLARLVIVVDEFRVLTQAMPECAELFVDIAARGRSLGIHLIASSQRTGGVISDAILANCSIRVSFRVSDKADSIALLGAEDAFHLPHLPGRAVMKATGVPLSEFHAARLGEKDFSQVLSKAQKWTEQSPQWSAHVPWQPELPYDLPARLMPPAIDHAAWLGLLDIPEHQVQNWTPYVPSRDGNLVITGPARSGVTTAVVALHAQFGGLFINDAEIAWDAVCEQADSLLRSGAVVCIEDLDHILDCMSHEHREHFITSLSRLVRVAPQRGAVLIMGCKPNPRGAHSLLELFPATLELSSSTQPGRGVWRGHQIHVVHCDVREDNPGSWGELVCEPESSYAVISHRTASVLTTLTQSYGDRVRLLGSELNVTVASSMPIIVGTPDEWMLNPAKFTEMRKQGTVIIDGCSPSELRGLRLRPGLFPHAENDTALVVEPDGTTTRAVLRT
jgi:S-DNA-T family DNA segregation ATPase FtsK/SpoIIIE